MMGRIRQPFFRNILLSLIAFVVLWGGFADAANARRFAALAIDAQTGRTLYARNADARCYPASLTKIMTLYILFEELRAGRVSYGTRMRVSRRAANQAPSKLGLKPGQTIRVIDAIKALVTKSANDVAVVVAEHISRSERRFAKRMTRTARRLGMKRTRFRNASGLPDRRQVTTARDMARLGRRIERDFPRYYAFFRTRSFVWKGRRYGNHNRLLGRYRGVDGIKTGYTRASGFNLVSSVRRNNRHLIAVVLGGRTGRDRDRYMVRLLNKTMPRTVAMAPSRQPKANSRTRNTIRLASASNRRADRHVIQIRRRPANAGLEDRLLKKKIATMIRKPYIEPVFDTANALEQGRQETGSRARIDLATASITVTKSPAVPQTRLVKTAPDAVRKPEAPKQTEQPEVKQPEEKAVADVPALPYNIQVGAYANKLQAETRLNDVRKYAERWLRNSLPFTQIVTRGEQTFYRARFGIRKLRTAKLACNRLRRKSIDCIVLRN